MTVCHSGEEALQNSKSHLLEVERQSCLRRGMMSEHVDHGIPTSHSNTFLPMQAFERAGACLLSTEVSLQQILQDKCTKCLSRIMWQGGGVPAFGRGTGRPKLPLEILIIMMLIILYSLLKNRLINQFEIGPICN